MKIEIESVQCSVLFYFTLYVTSGYSISLIRDPDLVSFILVLQLEGDEKEPVTLFENLKSKGRSPRCHGLSDLCLHWSGWARCDQNMD